MERIHKGHQGANAIPFDVGGDLLDNVRICEVHIGEGDR